MKLFQTKTDRELEAVKELEDTLQHRQRRQRITSFVVAGATIVAIGACIARLLRC